jgi:WD40 repeat protein
MSRALLATAVLVSLSLLIAAEAAGRDARTILQSSDQGTILVESIDETGAPPAEGTGVWIPGGRESGVIWQRTHLDATYNTAAFAGPPAVIAAGTYLNPPKQVEVVPIGGNGTPDWVQGGEEFHTAASRDGSVIAAVDFVSSSTTVTVHRWDPASNVPLWSYPIGSATRGSHRTIAVSADGSTIAVLVSMVEGTQARLYLFDADSPTPIGVYDGSGFARNLSIGEDGRFVAFIGLSTAYVVDRDADAIRWSGSMGATNDPIAITTDGNYLAFGWTSLQMRQWNGTSYANLWSIAGGAYTLYRCEFSGDGGTFAAGWARTSFDQNRIQLFEMPSGSPLWTRFYDTGAGAYQDIPGDLALTHDGGFLAVGSWGDQLNTNPEVHLFAHASSEPVLTVDTPGSMFDVDILDDGGCGAYVTACGKHVHANQTGRGGDLYSIHYDCPTGTPGVVGPLAEARLEAVPNPCRASMPIRFVLSEPGTAELAILTADGRGVRSLLNAPLAAGPHEVTWDGNDARGRPVAAGAYFVRLRAGREADVARFTRLR